MGRGDQPVRAARGAVLGAGRTRVLPADPVAGRLVLATVTVLGGLLFYEKTILVLGVFGIVALSYFATGGFWHRMRHVLVTYRLGVAVLGSVAVGYGVLYDRGRARASTPVRAATTRSARWPPTWSCSPAPRAWSAGRWPGRTSGRAPAGAGQRRAPCQRPRRWLVLVEVNRARLRAGAPGSYRRTSCWRTSSWCCGSRLVGGAEDRARLSLRGELGPPPRSGWRSRPCPFGARWRRSSRAGRASWLDDPQRVAALTALVAVLGTVSTVQYVTRWQDDLKAERCSAGLPTIEGAKQPMPLVDRTVPD